MTEYWESWVGTTAEPIYQLKPGAKVTLRDGRKWITYRDYLRGQDVIIEMPDNALTRRCDQQKHDRCSHRLGQRQEGGVLLRLRSPSFIWRCGCPCHNDPHRAGRLF